MSEEQIAQEAARQTALVGASEMIHEPSPISLTPDLFSPLNDGRMVFSGFKEDEVLAVRFAERLQKAYEYLKLDDLAADTQDKITTMVETSKGRNGSYLKTLFAKHLELSVSPSEGASEQPQRRGRR